MNKTKQNKMRAIAVEEFGGLDNVKFHELPIPEVKPEQVLIKVEAVAVEVWDPADYGGAFARMYPGEPEFPYVIGSEGAGKIAQVGSDVEGFQVGDRVFGINTGRTQQWGFYAEYIPLNADKVWKIPDELDTLRAAVTLIDSGTALTGLKNVLDLQKGENLMVFGASGGIGHFAVQLGKIMGANVLAVASGDDGVEYVKSLDCDKVINGYTDNIKKAAREFSTDGIDAALLTAGGEKAKEAIEGIKPGGRVAYPNGIQDPPEEAEGINIQSYDGKNDRELINELLQMIDFAKYDVLVSHSFDFDDFFAAQKRLNEHYLGKLALEIK